jgi:prepilin-type N-terminal cleavage/methylation domain-containing protein
MRQIINRQSLGFSLAEMSVVLMIIGVIASSAISVAISNDYNAKSSQTEEKLKQIDAALAGYLAINHRLPCPADGTLAITDANFGVEATNGAAIPICNKNFKDGADKIWGGVVPVATLQLPNDFMFDGWGNRIDYIVDFRFTIGDTSASCTAVSSSVCFRDILDNSPAITVQDANLNTRTDFAVYVLLSHGANGHGAFPKPGSATTARINGFPAGSPYRDATASANEFTNAKVDNTGTTTAYSTIFVMQDFVRNDNKTAAATARTYFDDQLHYRTKQQIVIAAGAKIYDPICKRAADIVNGLATTCSGAADPTQCQTFANEVNSRCLQ